MSGPVDRATSSRVVAEAGLPVDVVAALPRAVVVGPVVADHAGLRVEQVGVPEQPVPPVEHRSVHQRPPPPGVELADQPQPALLRRAAEVVRQRTASRALWTPVQVCLRPTESRISGTVVSPAAAIMSSATTAPRGVRA
jgi:hypothetical protein